MATKLVLKVSGTESTGTIPHSSDVCLTQCSESATARLFSGVPFSYGGPSVVASVVVVAKAHVTFIRPRWSSLSALAVEQRRKLKYFSMLCTT